MHLPGTYVDFRILSPVFQQKIQMTCVGFQIRFKEVLSLLREYLFNKAHYRRGLASYELNDLDQALADAERVVQHYYTQGMQNPEALKFRE